MPITHYMIVPTFAPLQKWGRGLPVPEVPYPTDQLKWSGGETIPEVGHVIDVTMNGLGRATVTGYFVETHSATDPGFLGIRCALHKPPQWWVKQNAERLKQNPRVESYIFGCELQQICQECSYPAGHDTRCRKYAAFVQAEIEAGNILPDEAVS